MSELHYDLIVIGGGPAGYTAALRAAQLGIETLCVDERSSAGGTCLHVGCIPSKALLSSSDRIARARSEFERHGIGIGDVTMDLDVLMRRKGEVVERLTKGIDQLLAKRGVERIQGRGALRDGGEVQVRTDDGERILSADHVVLATGSTAAQLPDAPSDGQRILTSTEALALERVPERLIVIGGGYIGLELGSVWSRLGAEVTILEMEGRVLPEMDAELSEHAGHSLEEQGLRLLLEHRVLDVSVEAEEVVLRITGAEGKDGTPELAATHVLVAIGREPCTRDLGLERAGVMLDPSGFVWTDDRFRTTVPGVYAVGDIAGDPMLAHKGQLEALACVDAIAGLGAGYVDYDAIPAVVYMRPEVASFGDGEEALQRRGIRYRTGRSSFRHDSRALCTGDATGFVKLLVEEGSGHLLGAHIVGPHAGSLIHELVVTKELGGSVEELGRCAHAHPTLNETVREAALDAYGRAIHH